MDPNLIDLDYWRDRPWEEQAALLIDILQNPKTDGQAVYEVWKAINTIIVNDVVSEFSFAEGVECMSEAEAVIKALQVEWAEARVERRSGTASEPGTPGTPDSRHTADTPR